MATFKKILSRSYIFILLGVLYLPIIWMVIFSFTESVSFSKWSGFSIQNYIELFSGNSASDIATALVNTIIIGLASSVISTILGTFAAIGLNSIRNKRVKNAYKNANEIPMVNSEIVTAMSLMLTFQILRFLFQSNGNLELFEVILAHVSFCTPYVLLNVSPRLQQTDNKIYEAALDLGCTYRKAIFKVVIPDILPGIIAGFIMAFTISIDDFIITEFVVDGFDTLSTLIYSKASGKKSLPAEFRALSTIIFIVVFILLIIVNKPQKNKIKEANKK